MRKETVVIIGGGIAGLVAARELASINNVILLEALPRFGGRIYTVADPSFPRLLEGGAEFVHGEAEHTFNLLKDADIPYTKVEGTFYRKINNILEVQEDMIEDWDLLMSKMSGLTLDITFYDFLCTEFSGSRYHKLRRQALSFAAGFDLADPSKASTKSLYKEWCKQGDDYRIEGGYGALLSFLIADCKNRGCKLINNKIVGEINWKEGGVKVSCADDIHYEADRCLITIPVSVLQSAMEPMALKFSPLLPDDYREAVNSIGVGGVIKVVLTFSVPFWEMDGGFFFGDGIFPTWWSQLPHQVPILTGWTGGPGTFELSKLSDDHLLEKALLSISAIFNIKTDIIKEKLIAYHVFNWQNQSAFLGAYTYALLTTDLAVKTLSTPLKNTLFFAGEGIYSGIHPGTVEAAIVSSRKAAALISNTKDHH